MLAKPDLGRKTGRPVRGGPDAASEAATRAFSSRLRLRPTRVQGAKTSGSVFAATELLQSGDDQEAIAGETPEGGPFDKL